MAAAPERLNMDAPPADPVAAVQRWLDEAVEHAGRPNPLAMTLATVDGQGRPSARMMLLKGFDARGAVFFTNRQSRKGLDLAENDAVALLLHWDGLGRQLRIEGGVSPLSEAESDAYFASRPRPSQIGALASDQSRPLDSRSELEARYAEVEARYPEGTQVPRPRHWSGFRVSLERLEFWQDGDARLHDRVVYTPCDEGWAIQRLWP